jgi:hypothetical protein
VEKALNCNLDTLTHSSKKHAHVRAHVRVRRGRAPAHARAPENLETCARARTRPRKNF